MLFPLKLQRDNRKKALAVDPAEGKTGKNPYFTVCGDETATDYDRALSIRYRLVFFPLSADVPGRASLFSISRSYGRRIFVRFLSQAIPF